MEAVLERAAAEVEDDYVDFAAMDDRERAHKQYIREKLAESAAYAARLDAKWYTREEFWAHIKEKFPDAVYVPARFTA
jgi:hypothetical protein